MKVRIGIITHNRREVLVKAIESAIAQTHEPKEIIVIDDASTDDTMGLAKQFPQVDGGGMKPIAAIGMVAIP